MEPGLRLLVVDDEQVNRLVLGSLIRKLCATLQPQRDPPQISEAEDGLAAVAAARAGKFDCVFMDLMMPVMDGCDAIKTMHAEGMRIPIIVVTAMDPMAVRRLPLHAVLSIVFKPVSMTTLRPPMEMMLDSRQQRASR
jgi:CheY-like chemotaxis protein